MGVSPSTTTSASRGATTTAATGSATSLPIRVEATNDGVSPSATVLAPSSCHLSDSTATATGGYGGFVAEDYHRVGDVVELYVYTAPTPGYPDGIQVGELSSEKPALVASGSASTWTSTVPVGSLGSPTRCAVTVQATHQFEGAPNAY